MEVPKSLAAALRVLHRLANGPAEPLPLRCELVAWMVCNSATDAVVLHKLPLLFLQPILPALLITSLPAYLCSKSYLPIHILLLGIGSLT